MVRFWAGLSQLPVAENCPKAATTCQVAGLGVAFGHSFLLGLLFLAGLFLGVGCQSGRAGYRQAQRSDHISHLNLRAVGDYFVIVVATWSGCVSLVSPIATDRFQEWSRPGIDPLRPLEFLHCGHSDSHSITLSVITSNDCGILRSNALAVVPLMNISNFVGCSTGRSAGLAPLKILST